MLKANQMEHKHHVVCDSCGSENTPNRLFCARCGAYLGGLSTSDMRGAHHGLGMPGVGRPARRSHGILGPFLLVVLLAAMAVTGLLVYRQYRDLQAGRTTITLASTTVRTTSTTNEQVTTSTRTTTANQGRIFPSMAKASSSLPSTGEFTYGPENLSDNDLTTAWNEGAPGDGVGEWVSFTFSAPVHLIRIDIANGYQRDQRRFLGNGRVDALRIEYSTGAVQEVRLHDDMGYQEIQPVVGSNDEVTSVRLTILSVHPGQSWQDAALSEVRFIGTRP